MKEVTKASFIIFIWQMSREGCQNDKNQDKNDGHPMNLVALLSLTHKSNFHILAVEKGEFTSAQINTTPIEWSMYDGASALGTFFEAYH